MEMDGPIVIHAPVEDDLKTLVFTSCPNSFWEPLVLKEILQMYHEAGVASHISEYIKTVPKNDNERALVVYLDSLRHGSYKTVELYARYIVGFLNYAQKPFVATMYTDVRDYLKSFEGAATSTVNTILASLKSFYKMMSDSGIVSINPTSLIKISKVHRSTRVANTVLKAASVEEVAAHKKYLKEKSATRNYAMVSVFSSMGLRAAEMCTLNLGDYIFVQDKQAFVLHIKGKGKKERMMKISPTTLEALRQYLFYEYGIVEETIPVALRHLPMFPHLSDKNKRLTSQAVYKMVTRMCKRSGQRHRSPHSYRHHCFTRGAQHGVPLEELQRAAGHSDINTTLIYVDANNIFAGALADIG